jgi:hypothetical protein
VASAGWFPDNNDPSVERYWDGAGWTAQTRPGVQQTMPLRVQGPPSSPGAGDPQRPRWYSRAWVIAPIVGLVGLVVGVAAASSGAATNTGAAHPTAIATVTITKQTTTTVKVTPPPVHVTVTESATPSSKVGNTSAPSDGSFVMPNEVGKGLQASQDDLQAISGDPLYYSASHDALGAHRFQILDADWKVCSQNHGAGTRVTQSMLVTFNVVKLDESCP